MKTRFCENCGGQVAPEDTFCPSCGSILSQKSMVPQTGQYQVTRSKKKLYRSSDRWIAGVIGGIAEYYEIDIVTLRLLFLLFCVFTLFMGGFLIAFYIALWILIPEESKR